MREAEQTNKTFWILGVDKQPLISYYNNMKQTKGANVFKKISTYFGVTSIFLGLMVAAGSAGDCDGKCMEMANDLSTMIILSAVGILLIAAGIFFVMVGNSE